MAWVAVGSAVAGGVVSGALNKSAAKKASQGSTSKVELDPRMQGLLYGDGQRVLRPGVQAKMGVGTAEDYKRYLNNQHLEKYGVDIPTDEASQAWLTQGIADLTAAGNQVQVNPDSDFIEDKGFLGRVTSLLDTPQNAGMQAFGTGMDAYLKDYGRAEFDNNMRGAVALRDMRFDTPTAQAAQVQAPSQNNLNLAPAYQDMVYGAPGANPYLTGAVQKGINQSANAFTDMMSANTRNLMENVMPGIRGGARVSGNYGSDREGIAQGKALDTFNTQLGQSMQRFGQGNTDAAVAAQAGAYDTDRNRALSAMSGLGAQQYGVAGQNAQFQQQAALANQQAQLANNAMRADNLKAGVSMSSGLLGQAAGYGQNQDAYAGQKMTQAAGLLAPFTGLGSTQVNTTPMYGNTGASVLGGAMLGQQLARGLGGGKDAYGNTIGTGWNSGYDYM